MDSVALVKYGERIKESLKEGLDQIGGFGVLGKTVFIKPNICTISDNTGFSVTNVDIIEAIIDLLLEKDATLEIKIVESDSQSKFAIDAFDKFGYKELAEKKSTSGYDVQLVDLSAPPLMTIPYVDSDTGKLSISAAIDKPEKYYISVAVAKTHYLTFITGTLKNQFGLLARKDQGSLHSKIDEVIVTLNHFAKPDLCIIDARIGVEGWNGPKTREIGALIVGHHPVSVDATLIRVMGFEPEKASHLIKSSHYNLGSLDPTVLGESIDSIRVKFKEPK